MLQRYEKKHNAQNFFLKKIHIFAKKNIEVYNSHTVFAISMLQITAFFTNFAHKYGKTNY